MFLTGVYLGILYLVYWRWVPAPRRRLVFGLATGALLLYHFPSSVLILAALTLLVYGLLPAPGSGWTGRAYLAVLVAVAAIPLLRSPDPMGTSAAASTSGAAGWLPVLGISYAAFRLIALTADRASERVTGCSRLEVLEYVLFPPTFLSGPIERYSGFRERFEPAALSPDDRLYGLGRIVSGLLKKVLLVEPLIMAADPAFAAPGTVPVSEAWLALVAYGLFVYLDFSAYCDLAIGTARLFGFRLSENFNWPYLAGDIGEFWRRWHISLSEWLRDHIYLPTSVALLHRPWFAARPLAIGMTCSLVTMALCGIWHGAGWSFLLWGLGQGALLATHQAYRQLVLGRLKVRKRMALQASWPYRIAATLLTFTSVSLLWVLFRLQPDGALVYYRHLLGWS